MIPILTKGLALRYGAVNSNLLENTTIGASFFNSNDQGNANAINANTTGAMIDVSSEISGVAFGAYYGVISFSDSDSATSDDASIAMVYVEEELFDINFAARYSVVNPSDYNGDGAGISSGFDTSLGLSDIAVSDVDVSRLQLSGTYKVSESVSLVNELIMDTYGENRTDFNNTAVLSYASLTF